MCWQMVWEPLIFAGINVLYLRLAHPETDFGGQKGLSDLTSFKHGGQLCQKIIRKVITRVIKQHVP